MGRLPGAEEQCVIYGWGTDVRSKQVDQSTMAVCRFKYVSVAFIFSFVWQRRFFLRGRDRAMDREVTLDELSTMYGPAAVPGPGLWRRFGVFFTVGAFLVWTAVYSTFGALFGAGDEPVAAEVAVGVTADTEELADGGDPDVESASDGSGEEGAVEALGASTGADATGDSTPASATDPAAAANDDGTADGGDGSVGDATPTGDAAAEDRTATGSTTAEVGAVQLRSESNLISTDPGDPVDEYGEIIIDGVHATGRASAVVNNRPTEFAPAAGNKLVVVDYQMLFVSDMGNFRHDAFRLVDADGRLYPAANLFGTMAWTGSLYNQQVIFEVPVELTAFTLQAGTPDDQRDGYQASWSVELKPGDISGYGPDTAPVVEGPAAVSRIGDSDLTLTTPGDGSDQAAVTVLSAEVFERIDGNAADEGSKWLVVETQVVQQTRGVLSDETFRVQANGEWYPLPVQINEQMSARATWLGELVFQIPASAVDVVFEAGTPSNQPDATYLQYDIALPQ